MDFLKHGEFISHFGKKLRYKIDCDTLSDGTWECYAAEISRTMSMMGGIKEIHAVPRGGIKLANALQKYARTDGDKILIVDDVLTTGKSMEEKREELVRNGADYNQIVGFVLICRSMDTYHWINTWAYISSVFKD